MVLMIGILGYEKVVYESSYGHKEDLDVASSLFVTSYRSIFRKTFSNYQSTVWWKILTNNWIVQSLRDMFLFLFIMMWYNVPRFCAFVKYIDYSGWEVSSFRCSVLGEMIQIICHIFGSLRSINVKSGDKSRSSVLVPVGPYNCVVLHFAPFSSLSQVFLLWKILSRCILLSQRRSLTVNI